MAVYRCDECGQFFDDDEHPMNEYEECPDCAEKDKRECPYCGQDSCDCDML